MPVRPLPQPVASSADSPALPRRGFLGKVAAFLAGGAVFGRVARAATAPAPRTLDGDPFIGEIMLFAGNFAPTGWATCDGQVLSIAQYTALFSLLGTTYGGDGRTTFALPDLRGRVPIHMGQGPGLQPYFIGQNGGEESHTLIAAEMPAHAHQAMADAGNGTSDTPTGALPARNPAGIPQYSTNSTTALSPGAIASAGGGAAHNNLSPYLTLNYCIALQGIFPSRP
jgi:microcystin-dependent protein